jgi:predicted esterase
MRSTLVRVRWYSAVPRARALQSLPTMTLVARTLLGIAVLSIGGLVMSQPDRRAAVLSGGCRGDDSPRTLGRGGGPPALTDDPELPVTTSIATTLPPLTAESETISLPVPGRSSAVAVVPLGATDRRPILVAAHGRNDRPEALCAMWSEVVQRRGFVLCPRGVATDEGGFTYDSDTALRQEIDADVEALRARFPDHVDEGPLVYSGFSLGAFQGVEVVAHDPGRTPRAVFIEGGHDPWTQDVASTFAKGGGDRVLFVTGQEANRKRAEEVSTTLRANGVATKVEHVQHAGHAYNGAVQQRIASSFDWLVEGDERWMR